MEPTKGTFSPQHSKPQDSGLKIISLGNCMDIDLKIQIKIHKSLIHRILSLQTLVVVEIKLQTTYNFMQLDLYG